MNHALNETNGVWIRIHSDDLYDYLKRVHEGYDPDDAMWYLILGATQDDKN